MTDQLSNDLASLRIDRGAPPPKRGSGLLRSLVTVLVVAGLGSGAYIWAAPELEARFFKTGVETTGVLVVSPAQGSVELTSTGYVVPQIVSLVGAKIPGRVAKIYVREGDQVHAGDVLLELESADQKANRSTATSRVAAARARVATARANLAEIDVQLTREKKLVEAGVAPQANVDNLDARAKALTEAITAAEAEVKAAAAEVNAVDVNLGYMTITSPIDGTVINKPPEVGELVGALTLEPLSIEVADLSSMVVETDVPEGRLHLIKKDSPAEIVLDAFPNRRFRGQTLEVSPKINRQKATVRVKVKFVDPMDGVLPEMSARVSFLSAALDEKSMKEPPKTVVPAAALVDRSGRKHVFVVESEKVRLVPVSLGAPMSDGFEMTAGPSPGTRLVKNPPATLVDGQRIKEKNE